MLKFRGITYNEIDLLKNMTLRKADIDEMRAGTGFNDPWSALKYAVANSNEWTDICYYEETGEVITVYGLASNQGIGNPWMFASPKIRNHKKLLMVHSKKMIQRMHEQFETLCNYVDSRNVVHIHWLKHMGFKFTGEDLMIGKIPFKFFYKLRSDANV